MLNSPRQQAGSVEDLRPALMSSQRGICSAGFTTGGCKPVANTAASDLHRIIKDDWNGAAIGRRCDRAYSRGLASGDTNLERD